MYAVESEFSYDWNLYGPVTHKRTGERVQINRKHEDLTGRFCRKVASILDHEAHRMELYMSRFNCHVEGSPLHSEEEEAREIQRLRERVDKHTHYT